MIKCAIVGATGLVGSTFLNYGLTGALRVEVCAPLFDKITQFFVLTIF